MGWGSRAAPIGAADRERPMVQEGAGAFSAWRRLAQRARTAQRVTQPRCELCAAPLPAQHRHLYEQGRRVFQCVCCACALLFDHAGAAGGKYRLVPDRCLALTDFALGDAQWQRLGVPVGLAFFFHSSAVAGIVAVYPSPAGPIESLVEPDAWRELATNHPALQAMVPDIEALLVSRLRETWHALLAPIDECYSLVGLVRQRWRGFGGGQEVWQEIEQFFAALQRRATAMPRSDGHHA